MNTGRWIVPGGLAAWVLAVVAAGPATLAADDWGQWGGPNRDFAVSGVKLADQWPDGGPKKLWNRPLGKGYSAIVSDGKALYTMYRDGDNDVVVSLAAKDGTTLWEHRYPAPTHGGQVLDFGVGPNSTPLIVGNRMITIGFTGKLHGYDLTTHKPAWSHDLVKDMGAAAQKFGYASSPMLYKGNVLVLVGGSKHGIVAFDPATGKTAWTSEPMDISYASPVLINVDGQDQVVFFTPTEVVGVDPNARGKKLWSHPVENQYKNNCTDAIWGPGNLLWAATQMNGATRVIHLTQSGGKTSVEQVWFNDKVKVFHWNAVRDGDQVYASIGGRVTFLAGIDLKTGKVNWQQRGYHKANGIMADGKWIFVDENGKLVMAKPSPSECRILAEVQLLEKSAWTAPTLIGKTLYIRDNNNIMALDLGS